MTDPSRCYSCSWTGVFRYDFIDGQVDSLESFIDLWFQLTQASSIYNNYV